jgi:hypothetical protein
MLNCCVNPVCRAEFRLLGSGDFYALERRAANTEYFWLCPDCATRFELHIDGLGCVSPKIRGERGHGDSPKLDANLRLVAHTVRRMLTIPAGECVGVAVDCSVPTPSHSSLRLHSF